MSEKRLYWITNSIKKISYALNDKDEEVGCLEYGRVGAHMHWIWHQTPDFGMSPGCLQEVRDKQKKLYREVRKK